MFSTSVIIIPVNPINDNISVNQQTGYSIIKDRVTNSSDSIATYFNKSRVSNTNYGFAIAKVKSNIDTDDSRFETEKSSLIRTYVETLDKFKDYSDLSHNGVFVYTQNVSTIVSQSYSIVFNYNSKFPDFCDNDGAGINPATEKLIDKTDNNLIVIGSEIRHVVYGKYYDNIYQFDKEFLSRVGTNFRITGLSTNSLVFDTSTYTLKGSIPFTNTKEIKFIINDTYKFTLTLIVDVREEFYE